MPRPALASTLTSPWLASVPVTLRIPPVPRLTEITPPARLVRVAPPVTSSELQVESIDSRWMVPALAAPARAVSVASWPKPLPCTQRVTAGDRLPARVLPAPLTTRVEGVVTPAPTFTRQLRASTLPLRAPPVKLKVPYRREKKPAPARVPPLWLKVGLLPLTWRLAPGLTLTVPRLVTLPVRLRLPPLPGLTNRVPPAALVKTLPPPTVRVESKVEPTDSRRMVQAFVKLVVTVKRASP